MAEVKTQTSHGRKLSPDQWSDIQALIVYGFRNLAFGRFLFLHVDDTAKAKQWLRDMINEITTVKAHYDGVKSDTITNIALTHSGFRRLGLAERTCNSFSNEFIDGMTNRAKVLGDVGTSDPDTWHLGNPNNDPKDEIDLLVFINGITMQAIDALLSRTPYNQIGTESAGVHIVLARSNARAIGDQIGMTPSSGKEPFGFRDGISNPWIEGTRYSENINGMKVSPLGITTTVIKTIRNGKETTIGLEGDPVIKTGEFILGYENEYDQLPQTPLVWDTQADLPGFEDFNDPDFSGIKDFGRNGSYLVYRKMAQNVAGFWSQIAENTRRSDGSLDPQTMTWAGAKFVGRWPSGVPLVMSPDKDNPERGNKAEDTQNNSLVNSFHYIKQKDGDPFDDENAFRCPVGSHLRRANPRDSLIDDKDEKNRFKNVNRHRIMRRSASFGQLADHQVDRDYFTKNGAPTEITYNQAQGEIDPDGVGIHFFGVNASIQQQFEFIQQAWNIDPRFNGMYDNKDPIVGNNAKPDWKDAENHDPGNNMTIPREADFRLQIENLAQFVTIKGGAYFFLPSIRALKYLAKG